MEANKFGIKVLCFVFFVIMFFGVKNVYAQVTTGGIKGRIEADSKAVITLTNKATNEIYNITSHDDGSFVLYNLTPGSDYILNIKGETGEFVEDNVTIYLGEDLDYGLITLKKSDVKELEGVTVQGDNKNSAFNILKTGASTVIKKSLLQEMPASSRSIADLTKLTPQSNGYSFGGVSNRFNNLQIDGAQSNDVFGLGTSMPGSQAGTQPISLDAIQEIQVVLSPYNVTLGNFSGAGINAVTRSGSNNLEGSVYGFLKSNTLQGKNPLTNSRFDQYSLYTVGARVGGAIQKNKLFYFVNVEMVNQQSPTTYNAGDPEARLTIAEAQQIKDFFKNTYNYDAGSYESVNLVTQNVKLFGKLDYVISPRHKLTLRHNFVTATSDQLVRSPSGFVFENGGYQTKNLQNATVLELKSTFSSNVFNDLIIGYSNIQDIRSIKGELFPFISVNDRNISIGTEPNTNRNNLSQQTIELTNNLKYIVGNHIFTIGTHNELFLTHNSFIQNLQGNWQVPTLADLNRNSLQGSTNRINRFTAAYPAEDGGEISKVKLLQLGGYVQGESKFFNRLTLNYGIRLDVPIFLNSPLYNANFDAQYGINNSKTGSGQLLWSPRFGFKYQAVEKIIQIRGGVGIFTGRVPLVWISNNYANNGINVGAVNTTAQAAINNGNGFNPDPSINTVSRINTGSQSYVMNVADNNFKFPQVLRTNLAVDLTIPGDIELVLEGIFSKTLNNVYYQKINFNTDADGNFIIANTNTNRNAPLQTTGDINKPTINRMYRPYATTEKTYGGDVYYLRNTSQGYSYTLTVQANKKINLDDAGIINIMAAYTYGQSKDINSGGSSVAASNFNNNFVPGNVNFNQPQLTYSLYDIRHRIIANLNYKIKYAQYYATTVSLFFSGTSGTPTSLTYTEDVNGDNRNGNDLIYIPTELEINNAKFTQSEKDNLNNFINSVDALSSNRGHYTERNAIRNPWEYLVDARILQDVTIKIGSKRHAFQLSCEIFNLGNLLNKQWGTTYSPNWTYGVFNSAGKLNPQYVDVNSIRNINAIASTWSLQLGIRYSFN